MSRPLTPEGYAPRLLDGEVRELFNKGIYMRHTFSLRLILSAVYGLSIFFITSMFTTVSVSAQDDSIADILPRVQENVAALKARTADFVCRERKSQSHNYYATKLTGEQIRTSTYTYIRYIPAQSDEKTFRPSSFEHYTEMDDGDKTVAKKYTYDSNKTLFKKSNIGLNGFDALFSWLDKENEKCFDFELLGSEAIESRDAYKIRITAKKDAKRAGKICQSFQKGWNSTIWIDRETMQVARLLTDPVKINIPRIVNLFVKGSFVSIDSFDYAPVAFGQEHWWLPVANHYILKTDERVIQEGRSEYRDYQLFTSFTKIKFENLQE